MGMRDVGRLTREEFNSVAWNLYAVGVLILRREFDRFDARQAAQKLTRGLDLRLLTGGACDGFECVVFLLVYVDEHQFKLTAWHQVIT